MQNDLTEKRMHALAERYRALPIGKKVVLIVFIIWAIQAIPKWSLAIFSDGQVSSQIMQIFITPK